MTVCGASVGAHAQEPVDITIVGGLSGVSQFTKIERPFWTSEIPVRSGGRVRPTVRAYDESGLGGQEMLQLMRLGLVPFGTALLAVAAGEEPELNAVDLAAMNPDIDALRRTVDLYRDRLGTILRDRYRVELLAIYTYPAQVLFCTRPFKGLRDMAGRRVRTSSVSQSELVAALGGTPVVLPFAETVKGIRDGVADCAITGTLSGNEIGLADTTTHIHALAINWGISVFAANRAAWRALPEDVRTIVRQGASDLERRIWESAGRDTATGLACNTGSSSCEPSLRKSMTLVPISPEDQDLRRRLLTDVILPKWIERCGGECATSWNALLAGATSMRAALD